jgi:hypothetical protein
VKLKPSKTVVGADKLRWLGRIMSGDKIEIDRDRIAPLLEAEAPYDVPTLRSYMGDGKLVDFVHPAHCCDRCTAMGAFQTECVDDIDERM